MKTGTPSFARTSCMRVLRPLVLGLILSQALDGAAQRYAIPWHSLASGGFSSSGGTYRIVATIGQPNAGSLSSMSSSTASRSKTSGGTASAGYAVYQVVAGFGAIALQTQGAPALSLASTGGNYLFSWNAGSTGYALQQSSSLEPPGDWIDVDVPVVTNGNRCELQLPTPSGARTLFFRLHGK